MQCPCGATQNEKYVYINRERERDPTHETIPSYSRGSYFNSKCNVPGHHTKWEKCVCIYIYIYIYIERERERWRERTERLTDILKWSHKQNHPKSHIHFKEVPYTAPSFQDTAIWELIVFGHSHRVPNDMEKRKDTWRSGDIVCNSFRAQPYGT